MIQVGLYAPLPYICTFFRAFQEWIEARDSVVIHVPPIKPALCRLETLYSCLILYSDIRDSNKTITAVHPP